MSSRRKSSTPCMVRVVCDVPEQGDPDEMEVDKGMCEKGSSESCESSGEISRERPVNLENPDRQMFASPAEEETQERLEREEQSAQEEDVQEEEQDAAVEDVGNGEVKGMELSEPEMDLSPNRRQKGYECKYCPFSTQNLDDFKQHVDSSHPNVILNPLYLCAVCNFCTKRFDSLTGHNETRHPGETNFKFKRVKKNNQTILEQTIEDEGNSAECVLKNGHGQGENNDSGAFPGCISTTVRTPESIQSLFQGNKLKSQLDNLLQKDRITAVNINGTVIIPEPTILQGLSHVTPFLQRPPNFNSVPKIAVPLNTTKYNPSLDNNLTLITSFNKFPYPTHAEFSWLTAASKHPEEQIKVWFTTQRLKQGITWSPEEVEEARKKMFNGSIPPVHHTFTVLPTSPVSQPSAKAVQPPLAQHLNHIKTSISNGLTTVTNTTVPAGITVGSSHVFKRPLPTMFGPEPKRPVMAVAPHSEEKLLMAPPPPPPPLKDRLPMAPPPVPMEMKRPVAFPLAFMEMKRPSAAVPLMPPSSSSSSLSSCLSSKGKLLIMAAPQSSASHKTKPAVSLPSIIFPEALTRRSMLPPPIIAPPYKSYLMPHPLSISSKEKHPLTHALLAPDIKLPNSPTFTPPQIRRPTIIQSVRAPVNVPSQTPRCPSDGSRLKEQQAVELKASFPRGDTGLPLLSEANGVSSMDAKWPHNHHSPHIHNNGIIQLDGGEPLAARQRLSVPTHFPLLERMKGKTSEQLKVLEENFQRNSFPTLCDVDSLAVATRLSRQEIDSWFTDRRALRDDLEQALLNSMGTKRMSGSSGGVADKRLHQQQHQQSIQLNGIHKPSNGGVHLKSPPIFPIVAPFLTPLAPSMVPPISCSVPADSRSMTLLKDVFAQTRWPSPEEYNQLEARTGLARTVLVRWFKDGRFALKSGSLEWTDLFNKINSIGGGQVSPVSSSENSLGLVQRCQEGSITNSISSKVLEMDLGRLTEQQQELQDWFTSRLRHQNGLERKNGGQNGGGGGPGEVFGSWLNDGHVRRGQEPVSDREKKMAEDTSGRLTG